MIMKEFYLEYKGDELMQQLVAQVPKNILIISMLMIRNGNKLLPNGKILYEAINKKVVMKEIGDRYTNNTFENIKHIDEYGNEYWYARELSKVLEYKDWRNFLKVLNKAKDACKNSGFNIDEQLVEVNRLSKRKKLRYRTGTSATGGSNLFTGAGHQHERRRSRWVSVCAIDTERRIHFRRVRVSLSAGDSDAGAGGTDHSADPGTFSMVYGKNI